MNKEERILEMVNAIISSTTKKIISEIKDALYGEPFFSEEERKDFAKALAALANIDSVKVSEEEKPRLMTHRELFEWIIRKKGQHKSICASLISEALKCYEEKAEYPASLFLIKPLGSEEWVEPTVDIYERDCKKEAR